MAGSWNIRTLQDNNNNLERRTAIISKVLKKYNLDIVALSETRLPGTGQLKEKDYTFFWSGLPEEEHRHAGVGFAIKRSLAEKLDSVPQALNERLMTIYLPLSKKQRLFIISAYAPTMSHSQDEKEKFYEDLRQILKKVSPCDSILLLGDLNARVGSDHQAWPDVLGRHLLGACNSNGLLLLSLCSEFKLTITNSIFQQRNIYKGTWQHPRSKHWHTLDYVIMRQSERNCVKTTRAHRGTEMWSDHRLVRSKLNIHIPSKPRRSESTATKKINFSALKDHETASSFSKALEKAVEKCSITEDIESSWKDLKDVMYETSLNALGFPKKKSQDWFDENDKETSDIIDSMHLAHKRYMSNKSCKAAKNNYVLTKRSAQKHLRALKEKWWHTKAKELQSAADSNNTQAFYKGLKAVYGPQTRGASPLLSSDGKRLLVDEDKIMERWVEHYNEVLNRTSTVNMDVINSIAQREVIQEMDLLPTATEVKKAIKILRRGKPGKDEIPADVYIAGGPQLVRKMTKLLATIWQKGEVPQDFKDASIVSLFKNGKRSLCDNYRGISLLSVAGKILARIIITRINQHLTDSVYSESQCGFRKGRGTIDMIFCLRQLQEKSREHRTPLYMAFIDLTKAFDSVCRSALWVILEKLGVPTQMRKIIQSFHDGMLAQVVHNGKLSSLFEVHNGTKQGCVLAPLLFALYFAVMLNYALKNKKVGVPVTFRTTGGLFNIRRFGAKTKVSTESMIDFLFADDCALVSQSCQELQQIVDFFSNACKDFGLTISTKKTEIVFQPPPHTDISSISPPVICVNGIPLKTNHKFCYLGSTISDKATLENELHLRMSKASQAFGKLEKRLWSSHDISLPTKIDVYRAVVIPSLTYGCETWTPYRKHIKMLDAFHLRKLRSICNISWKDKITNLEVLSRCQISGIETFLLKSQLRWTGHVIRMEDHRLPKIMLYSQLANAKRPEGRPLLRYKDKLKENLSRVKFPKPDWEQVAFQRTDWRVVCNQHVTKFENERTQKMKQDREARKAPRAACSSDPFVCNICYKICKSNAGLSSHRRTQHPPHAVANNEAGVGYTCRICKKVCKSERGFKIHLRVHKN